MKLFLLLIFTSYFVVSSFSQTITLGSGPLINSITTASPVNIYYRTQVSQTVYTAAELNAAGISGTATINQLGYFVTNIPIYDIPGYTIQMKHTSATNAAGNLNGGYTTVKNAFTYSPTQGNWDMLALDTPFLWNGISNIVVTICWSQVQPTFNPSGQVRVYNTTSGYKYRRDDFGGSLCGGTPNIILNFKPQIRFIFESQTVWTGAINTDWSNNGNWTANVPDETMDVVIPNGVSNFPNLTGVAFCKNLVVQSQMNLAIGSRLFVHGDFANSGTFTDAGGFTTITGEGPNVINNSGSASFSTLIFQSSNGGAITGSDITITKELQVNKSTLNTNDLIILKSDATGTARINELPTECFYTLNMFDSWGDGWNGGFLEVLQDGLVIGTYQAFQASTTIVLSLASGSNVQLRYTAGNFENENSYNLVDPSGTTIFNDGPTPATGIVFTTTPSCGFTPPIQGEISMERYINSGETYWRFFSSAVQGATVQDYQDDFITAGYAGSPFPNFGWVSIYTYDETLPAGQGYTPVANSSQALGVGQGIDVWCGDTITGTQPFTIDLKGVANQGDIVMPVTYTNTGTINEDGWNLVGNPYASTIDWDSPNWTKTNIANAIQILNPDSQQYATYVNGASTNGGSRFIASQQAFWVYANASSPSLIATEKVKSGVDATFIKSGSMSPGMTIRIDGFAKSDECVLRQIEDAIDAFEPEFDAYKLYGGWGYPTVSLINTTQQDLAVHSIGNQYQAISIPLKVNVTQTGFYYLSFNEISEIDVPCIRLEDTYTGQFYTVDENQPLSFELSDTTMLPRFILHLGENYQQEITSVTCAEDGDGQFEIDLNQNQTFDYSLTLPNQVIVNGAANGSPFLLSDLEPGTHVLAIPSLQNSCNNTQFTFVIPSPSLMYETSNVINETLGGDASIEVNITGGTPPYSYEWSSGENVNTLTGLTEGNYTIMVVDNNFCEFEYTYTVGSMVNVVTEVLNVIELSYFTTDNLITIKNLNITENLEAKVYAVNGDLIEVFIIDSSTKSHNHKLKTSLANGVYFVKVNNQTLKFVK